MLVSCFDTYKIYRLYIYIFTDDLPTFMNDTFDSHTVVLNVVAKLSNSAAGVAANVLTVKLDHGLDGDDETYTATLDGVTSTIPSTTTVSV